MMNTEKIISIADRIFVVVVTISYLLSDKSNLLRTDVKPTDRLQIRFLLL